MATEGVRYIKIARIDKNGIDQTNTLQSLNQITIPYTSGDIVYTVVNITEKPTFFLYYVNPAEVDWSDRADIKYDFTGSLTSIFHPAFDPPIAAIIDINAETDNLGFLTNKLVLGNTQFTGSFYKVDTYPQKSLYIRASGSISIGDSNLNPVNYIISLNRGNTTYPNRAATLDSLTFTSSLATASFDLSFNEPSNNSVQPGDSYYLQIAGTSPTTILTATTLTSDSQFFVTSSNATNNQVGLIAEPYFGSNDFNRALDCQPLLNNAERVRKHNLYQDVDYSAGATEPVNFDLLISGSAIRADVQFSNYTTRRHVIPRYEGSKSTSKNLNRWTPGDTGTFGKTSTLESLKTVIAYVDWMGGWPPERMNATTAHVLYLIDADGNIGVPNTSENSLPNIQGAFQTGERFRISSRTVGSGEPEQFRTIIRGGQRIEPILSTQSGSNPGAQYTDIELVDIQATSGSATSDYQNTGYVNASSGAGSPFSFTQRLSFNPDSQGSSFIVNDTDPFGFNYSYYEVPSGAVGDAITLNLQLWGLKLGVYTNITEITKFRVGVVLKIENPSPPGAGGSAYSVAQQDFAFLQKSGDERFSIFNTINFSIPPQVLVTSQKISIEIVIDELEGELGQEGGSNEGIRVTFAAYTFSQTPLPTSTISPSTSTISDIWGYYDKTNYPYIITSSNAVANSLGALWRDSNVKQKDIEGSGLNPFALSWLVKTGDEFRFEGDERFTYMVKNAYGPNEGSGSRFSETGSIEIQFDNNLPVNSTFEDFNLDHFLIRRYVDDPSQIIFEGEKPLNSQGPYILTPELSTAELNKDIDDVITNLKERGLITGEEGS